MSVVTTPQDGLVHSYLFLRRAIGIIGTALPVVLIVGNLLWPPGGLLDSLSASYYSPLRGVFVGSISAIAVFLLSYRGYGPVDDISGDVAGTAAVGLALFPTAPLSGATGVQVLIGDVHLAFAGVFFLMLAFFCGFLFPRTGSLPATPRKRQRNLVYRVTGALILVTIVLLAVMQVSAVAEALHPRLWLETVAVLAFGVAWAVKGETLGVLRDRP